MFKRSALDEVGLLLVAPVLLILVFLLPEAVRESLVFRASSPSLITAFTAHYLHLSSSHLHGNLIIYFGAVGVGYPLAVLGGLRRGYLSAVLAILLAFPFVLSGLHLALLGTGAIVGFSGLALALIGLLPLVLAVYLRARIEGAITINDAPAVFFLGIGIISWRLDAPGSPTALITIGSAVIAVLYLIPIGLRLKREGRKTGPVPMRRGYVELPLSAFILLTLALAVGFPANPYQVDGPTTNLLLHLSSYSLGFLGGYLTNRIQSVARLPTPPPPPPPD